MNKKCKKCNNVKFIVGDDYCNKCRRKDAKEQLESSKTILEDAKDTLERVLELGIPNLIRKAKEHKKGAERNLEKVEFSYLCSLVLEEESLTILEENYRIVKNHSLYTSQKNTENGNKHRNNKEKLDTYYSHSKCLLQEVVNQNNNSLPYQCNGCGKKQNHSSLCNDCRERERERAKPRF